MKYDIYIERPRFKCEVKELKKKFHKVNNDINDLIGKVIDNPKSFEAIPGYAELLYKAKHPLKCANIGISGGLRLINVLDERNRLITATNIFFKGDKEDLTDAEYNAIFAEFQEALE
ncbi:hypothetical protein [Candidatus Magnetominusculus xianensis]|uniref:Uncharacterized protein n=1 Tax=Candidatus Magnetominusculus xianensis TaxID=1748249 RepID=A0ABR5SI33_9BACT|nr:hypothetical protein [Candidatus Magnetominusculus xianensis]KWT83455.1 hypothetical protein ASN18_2205 [Candidatus Magnetominusculus xianensis]MBF0405099.1 hypothetical protein [Nitrospirota bacterium]